MRPEIGYQAPRFYDGEAGGCGEEEEARVINWGGNFSCNVSTSRPWIRVRSLSMDCPARVFQGTEQPVMAGDNIFPKPRS